MGELLWLLKSLLLLVFLASVGNAGPAPQIQWVYPTQPSSPNVLPVNYNCGTCPAGYQMGRPSSNFGCGRCEPITQSCGQGNVLIGNQCQQCPCPGTNERRFGTACAVASDGQITCECSSEYTGRDCSQCAPGTVQNNQYPYNCLRYNVTNTQTSFCPPGNICNVPPVPQIVGQRQIAPPAPTVTTCPYTSSCSVNQGCPIQPPAPAPPPPQPIPWVPAPTPTMVQCPTAQCPIAPVVPQVQCPTSQCPIAPVPQPQPQPQPQIQCPITPVGPQPQPQVQCPFVPQPQVQCPAVQCPPVQCPVIQCPVAPVVPQLPCPTLQCPPVQGPCPPCPVQPPVVCPPTGPANCPPVNCPSPCATLPTIPACPSCPTPSCPSCPTVPACPQCPQICPQCPAAPPCNNCPSPCAPCPAGGNCPNCPSPCRDCPAIPSCPDCKLSCDCKNTTCPTLPSLEILRISPCICDPRGTMNQYDASCFCKPNVEGYRCDTCKPGYFALSTGRMEGCLQCWGSGVSTYCSAATFYRVYLTTSRADDGSIEITDEKNTIIYSKDNKLSWDGIEAKLTLSVSTRLFWSLPAVLKGNRLTSYGGRLRFSRMFTGGGTPLGADNDIIIVGGNGVMLIHSTFETQASGEWKGVDVVLDETDHWGVWRPGKAENEGSSYVATRFDILEVLADVQMILIRATFTTNTYSTSIKAVSLGSVSKSPTSEGLVLIIEQARCPIGYQGLSCESCAPGYFRDATDMSSSVFGICKFCPCGRNAAGCHISYGIVLCKCKTGFTGDRCQDREVITVTLDPFWIRDYEGTEVDFTCTFTTNSKRTLLMRLGSEDRSTSVRAEETRSLTTTFKLSKTLGRVMCEIVDSSNVIWAVVYAAIQLEVAALMIIPPPKAISLVMKDTFICVNETDRVEFSVKVGYYGSRKIVPEWRKEGSRDVLRSGDTLVISSAKLSDSGTYIAAATDGDSIGVTKLVLLVRQYPNAPNYLELGDDPTVLNGAPNSYRIRSSVKPSNKSSTNKSEPSKVIPPRSRSRPTLENEMQSDQVPVGYPVVVVSPEDIRVKVGETVTLRCNASGEEPLKFYWKSGSNDYIPVHVRVSRGALIFKSVIKEDEGSYYCVAWNNFGQVSGRANIYVEEDKPVPKQIPNTVAVTNVSSVPGANIYFDCSTNDRTMKPIWSRKSGNLPASSEVKDNGTLILYRVSSNETGSYICTGQGALGQQALAEATLNLLPLISSVMPTVSLSPKSPLKVRSGEKVRIECQGSGFPVPNIAWSRSSELSDSGSDKNLVSSKGKVTVYEIAHVTKSDEGKYTCSAQNDAGTKSESLSLIVDDAIICASNEFRCKSGDQCVPKEDRCDNERDCNDGSDELHCRKRTRRSGN